MSTADIIGNRSALLHNETIGIQVPCGSFNDEHIREMDRLMSSRQAAASLSVGTSTVKRWADEGVLPCVKTEGGHRRFQKSDVETLRRKQTGKDEGEQSPVTRWLDLLVADTPVQTVVAELMHERANLGSWWAVAELLGLVLDALGTHWERGTLSVIEEHIASDRLARGVSWINQALVASREGPTVLLVIAENDEHTLGLSLAELVAAEVGWRTTWLGRKTPLTMLDAWLDDGDTHLVAVSASRASDNPSDLERQYRELREMTETRDVELVVGGSGAWPDELPYGLRMQSFKQWNQLLSEKIGVMG